MDENNQSAGGPAGSNYCNPAICIASSLLTSIRCIGCGAAWAPVLVDYHPFESTNARVRHHLCNDCTTIVFTSAPGCAAIRAAAERQAAIDIECLRGLPTGGRA